MKLHFFSDKISGFGYLLFVGLTINTCVLLFLIGIGFFPGITLSVIRFFIRQAKKVRFLKAHKIESWIESELEDFFRDFCVIKKNLKLLFFPLLTSFVQLYFFYSIPYFVCLSLNVPVSDWLSVASAASFISMITTFIPLPGGSGGAEGGFLVFFRVFISSPGTLAVAILLWRFFTFYLPIFVGMIYSRNIRKRMPKTELPDNVADL